MSASGTIRVPVRNSSSPDRFFQIIATSSAFRLTAPTPPIGSLARLPPERGKDGAWANLDWIPKAVFTFDGRAGGTTVIPAGERNASKNYHDDLQPIVALVLNIRK